MKISHYKVSIVANVVDVVVKTIRVTNHFMEYVIVEMKFEASNLI